MSNAGGNILKDSYYKERLLKSSAASMYKTHQLTGKIRPEDNN
jgi:hypothetical protein